MTDKGTYSISDIAKQFGITTRTVRYYEELGLIHPERSAGGQRVFTRKEQIRLQLVFRGKKYGFSLEEIREMIQLFDRDPTGKQQLQKTIEYGKGKIEEVSNRIEDLVRIRTEMERLLEDFQTKLDELESDS
ncbi:MerR family transcriptional regulator [Ornithinibacillus sp. L9]|uniref:MerR family transcriptional regulator n=1 Tax=Ornithinibacillus caprae TaxID=2678566 RepID=A0A6N8FH50_9BACI|nr:MerR family DNA-binding transcriptional regulator [Ornithinibacillus caprae]MUK88992.1 MerR family transcriptional regulator [Ornithinibacillus caprae]